MVLVLVRYGEIALKSTRVRRRFVDRLVRNIHDLFLSEGLECLTRVERGRIFLTVADFGKASRALSRVFGLVSFSPVHETTHDMHDIERKVIELAEPLLKGGASFAIRATRTGSQGYTSQELAKALGSAVMSHFKGRNITVDLDEPDVELFVEVRDNRAYSFTEHVEGPGGMPYGTQGRALAILERKEDAAAAWLVAKRGCEIACAEMEEGLSEPLKRWCPALEVVPLNRTDCNVHPKTNDSGELAELARSMSTEVIVLGWDVKRVEKDAAKAPLPVFFPLVGLSDAEVRALLKRIMR